MPVAERRFLLVYFAYLAAQTGPADLPSPTTKKRPRPTSERTPVPESVKPAFAPFHVAARLITGADLFQAGMRLLDKGLVVNGTLSDGLLAVPEAPNDQDALPIIVGICNDRQGLDLVPEGLDKLGLRYAAPEGEADDVPMVTTSAERGLTSIGRAVVEIIWAASVAMMS